MLKTIILLKNKKFLVRFLKFGLIGASGIVVNSVVLWLAHKELSLPLTIASPMAIVVAIFNNFSWNDRFTWSENRNNRKYTYLQRLWKYYVSASLGGLINYLVLLGVTAFLGIDYLIGNLMGILAGMVSNFLLSELWVFRSDS